MVPKMAVGRPAKISMASRVVTVGPPRSLVPEGGSPGENDEAEAPNEPASRPARRVSAGVQVFDVYQGQGIEPGRKSVAIEVTIQPQGETLTDTQIDAIAERVVASVAKGTGGVLRG